MPPKSGHGSGAVALRAFFLGTIFSQAGLNEKLFLEFDLVQSLRYGENPHQSAKFYREGKEVSYSLAFARQLNGKELSYNNIQDANAALCIVREFDKPFCVGLKHMNPCGAATGKDVVEAWTKAYEADKVSIFGGIVATNCTVTREAAELMKPIFLEIIMAPKFDEGALEVLSAKKNLRLLEVSMDKGDVDPKQYVSVNGGLLVQDLDVATKAVTADMCVTKAKPAAEQMEDLNFGWHIVKHVKSNAIVAVKDGRTLGVGAGQMNRIGSAEIALKQAHAAGVTEGLVLASDGFFPFDDCVTLAAEYGVTAIVQPGGSVRDEDSIRKADEKVVVPFVLLAAHGLAHIHHEGEGVRVPHLIHHALHPVFHVIHVLVGHTELLHQVFHRLDVQLTRTVQAKALIFHLAVLHPLDEDDGRTFLTAIADHIGSS